jgi:TP901 family phage tail tape measure protein
VAKGTLTVRIVGDADNLKKVLGKAESGLKKFGKLATGGAFAAGAAVAGFATYGIKQFADFDQAMTNSTAIMGDLSDTMKKDMADAAREVAKTTKFSASEAAESFYFLASAGMDAAASMAALPQVAAFAQAGAFDMATATDLATDAQSALGLSSKDAAENLKNLTRVTDVFVGAATLANTSVEQIAEAMTNKAGTALAAASKSIEEGSAVLAAFADKGVKGAMAGEKLSIMLRDLPSRATANADAFKKFNIEVLDGDGNLRNMADVVASFETGLDGMSDSARVSALKQMGLTEAVADGIVTLLGSSEAIRGYETSLNEMGGKTQEVAEKQMGTFWAQLGLIKDNLIDVALSVGEALMPALMAFADWLKAKLPEVTGWFERVGTKFQEMLGIAEPTLTEMQDGLSAFNATASQTADGVSRSFRSLAGPSDQVGTDVEMGMRRSSDAMTTFADTTDEKLTEAGQMFKKLKEAWQKIWNEDIKPWLMGTLIPWLQNTFFPALIKAFLAAGKAVWGAFVQGIIGGSGGAGLPTPGKFGGAIDTGRGPVNYGTSPGASNLQQLHSGGVVAGRPGQEVPILAMAGETVLPTHKRSTSTTMTVVMPVYLDGREIGRSSALIDSLSGEVLRRSRLTAGAGL